MATVHSLLCWGGRLGKTVTFTDTGDVVNLTRHGLQPGAGVAFSTSGSLPTGLVVDTVYYAKEGADINKFLLYPTEADAIAGTNQVTFSGTGSGTHTAKGAYFLALDTGQLARYGDPGSERIYDGLSAWRAARYAAAGAYDTEICEIGEAFDDWTTAQIALNIPAAEVRVTPRVDGVLTSAAHGGVFDTGYRLKSALGYSPTLSIGGYRHTIEDITLWSQTAYAELYSLGGLFNTIQRCFIIGSVSTQKGGRIAGSANRLMHCVTDGVGDAYYFSSYSGAGNTVCNNLAANSTNGFICQSGAGNQIKGWMYSNIAANCTTPWHATNKPDALHAAGYNAATSGAAPWFTGTDTSVVIETTDFADFDGKDFSPALSTSPQVEAGIVVLDAPDNDIAGNGRPDYVDGDGDAWDIGPFEFDHGIVAPATCTLTLTNLVPGSGVLVVSQDGGTTHYSGTAAGTTLVEEITIYGDARDEWRIKVRKGTASPFYRPWETLVSATEGSASAYVSQIPDD